MATSGSKDFELAVDDYIEEAYERCGLEIRSGYDLKTAKRSLNLLFADWANRGLNRWTITQESISLADGVGNYPLGTLTMTVGGSGSFTIGETITGSSSSATTTVSTAVSFSDVQSSIDVLSATIRQNAGASNQTETTITRIGRDD